MDAKRAAAIRAMLPDELNRLPFNAEDRDEAELILGRRTALDVAVNRERASRFEAYLETMTPRQRRQRVALTLRCPENCLLVEIYLDRSVERGELVFLTAHTTRRAKTFFANGGTADDGMDPDMWAPIACRHGTGQFVLIDAIELVLFAGLPKGTSRRITDSVTLTSPSPNGTEVSEGLILNPPYGKWKGK